MLEKKERASKVPLVEMIKSATKESLESANDGMMLQEREQLQLK